MQLVDSAGRFAAWADSKPWTLGALFTIFYLVPTAFSAHQKPLWYDELIGLIGSQATPWTSIPRALQSGIDISPPLYHFLMRISMELFGDSHLVIRLQAIAGFYLLCLSLYLLAWRRSGSALTALTAAAAPLGTHLYVYAPESRAYPLMMGFSALSFLCYAIAAEDGPARKAALAAMTAATAAAISAHYYGFLLLAPLAAAEAVRWAARRRIDWGIAGGLAAACLAMLPHVAAARAHSSLTKGISIAVNWASAFYTYDYLLSPAGASMAFLLILFAVACFGGLPELSRGAALLRPHELAGALALALLPFAGMAVGMLITKQYLARYTSPMVAGYALLLAVAIAAAARGRRLFTLAAAAALLLAGGFQMAKTAAQCLREKAQTKALIETAAVIDDGRTMVAVVDVLTFLPLWYYTTPERRQRFVFPVSYGDARKYFALDTHDRIITAITGQRPDLIAPEWERFQESLGGSGRFLLWGQEGGWITPKLAAEGKAKLQLLRLTAHGPVYAVDLGR